MSLNKNKNNNLKIDIMKTIQGNKESLQQVRATKKVLFACKQKSKYRKDCSRYENLIIKNASLCNMDWSNVEFENIIFENCDLVNSDFSNALLCQNVQFISCNTTNTLF